jgi:SAM-dependent methyltransferase
VPNEQQVEAWNGGESVHYTEHADRYDRQLAPFTDQLLEHAFVEPSDVVLDIGCGCGVTTMAAARRARHALGVDISAPLLEVAADRARSALIDNVEFVVADAQTHAFAEGAFDVVISQFGLMFFDDPSAAFANLRRALAPTGRLAFICWQALEANEWLMIVAREVARQVPLPELGRLDGGPGMFALKDADETAALLRGVGFTQVSCEPISPEILLGGGGTVDDAADFLFGMGMARGLLGRIPSASQPSVVGAVRASLADRYEPGVGVRLGTAAWIVSARG